MSTSAAAVIAQVAAAAAAAAGTCAAARPVALTSSPAPNRSNGSSGLSRQIKFHEYKGPPAARRGSSSSPAKQQQVNVAAKQTQRQHQQQQQQQQQHRLKSANENARENFQQVHDGPDAKQSMVTQGGLPAGATPCPQQPHHHQLQQQTLNEIVSNGGGSGNVFQRHDLPMAACKRSSKLMYLPAHPIHKSSGGCVTSVTGAELATILDNSQKAPAAQQHQLHRAAATSSNNNSNNINLQLPAPPLTTVSSQAAVTSRTQQLSGGSSIGDFQRSEDGSKNTTTAATSTAGLVEPTCTTAAATNGLAVQQAQQFQQSHQQHQRVAPSSSLATAVNDADVSGVGLFKQQTAAPGDNTRSIVVEHSNGSSSDNNDSDASLSSSAVQSATTAAAGATPISLAPTPISVVMQLHHFQPHPNPHQQQGNNLQLQSQARQLRQQSVVGEQIGQVQAVSRSAALLQNCSNASNCISGSDHHMYQTHGFNGFVAQAASIGYLNPAPGNCLRLAHFEVSQPQQQWPLEKLCRPGRSIHQQQQEQNNCSTIYGSEASSSSSASTSSSSSCSEATQAGEPCDSLLFLHQQTKDINRESSCEPNNNRCNDGLQQEAHGDCVAAFLYGPKSEQNIPISSDPTTNDRPSVMMSASVNGDNDVASFVSVNDTKQQQQPTKTLMDDITMIPKNCNNLTEDGVSGVQFDSNGNNYCTHAMDSCDQLEPTIGFSDGQFDELLFSEFIDLQDVPMNVDESDWLRKFLPPCSM